MDDRGTPLWYAALIVIAFISWVVGKIREAQEAHRERKRNKDRPIRTDIGPPTSSSSSPPPPISQRDRAKEAMRETYRALGIPFPEDEAPAPASTPPPVPGQKPARQARPTGTGKAASGARLTADERKALKNLQQRRNARAASNSGSEGGYNTRPLSTGAATLRRLLRDRKATQQAILLKEVLDAPKSLQDDSL